MKILRFIFSCIVLFLTVSFAVSNKQMFSLTLWPFPFVIDLPVSFIVLVFSLLFFIFGGFYSWLLSVPVRNERYRQAGKIKELTQRIAELEAEKKE